MEEYIISKIQEQWPDAIVHVTFIKEASYGLEVSTSGFHGMNRLLQQKSVLSLFSEDFKSERLHALTLKTHIL